MDETDFSRSVVVYPNPANHYLNISFLDETMENVHIDMISSSGKLVLSKEIINRNNLEGIDLNNFSEGVYLLKFSSNNKTFSKKLVIMR